MWTNIKEKKTEGRRAVIVVRLLCCRHVFETTLLRHLIDAHVTAGSRFEG